MFRLNVSCHSACLFFFMIVLKKFSFDFFSPEYSLFVGDLTPDVDDGMLYEFFVKVYPSCRGGKVVLDQAGVSK